MSETERPEDLLAVDVKLWAAQIKLDEDQKKLVKRLGELDKALTKTAAVLKDELQETSRLA